MTREALLALFNERQRAWTARDADALGRTHAENGIVTSPMFATLNGRPAIADAYRSLFRSFTDWDLTAEAPIIEAERVAQPFVVSATHSGQFMGLEPTGRRFEIRGIFLFKMSPDGLIAEERRIYDFTGFLMRVGVLKGKPGF